MSKESVLETLSQTPEDQLTTVFGELYSQLILHLKTSTDDRSRSICIFKRFLNLEWLPNVELLAQLARICFDLKPVYTTNVLKIDQLVRQKLSESIFDEYYSVVNENCQILSCIRDIFYKLGASKPISEVQTIILDTMAILAASFKHCNDHGLFYATATSVVNESINHLFKLCNELLFQCLDFVSSVKIHENDDTDIEQLNSILEATFNVGTLVSNLELKTMAQLWKSFTSLLQKYSFALRDRFNLCQAIRYFYTEIEQKIVTVFDIPDKNRTVTLKILNFLLKVVLKLSEYFSDCLSKCLTELCQLITVLYQNSSTCAKYNGKSSEIAAEIENSLLPAIDPLISMLMKEDRFVEHFFELNSKGTSSSNVSKLLLLSVIMQKLVLSPPESVWSTCKLFETIFQSISSCVAELHFDVRITVIPSMRLHLPQEVYLYDALLVHSASLIICAVSERDFHHIERLLVMQLLRSSLGIKLFICDLWCVLVRYGRSELCFEHAKLLAALLRQIHYEKIENVIIKSLLRRFFKFLSRAQQQKFVNIFSKDLSTLTEVCHPNMKCTLSVCDTFATKASERIQELSLSSSISSQDVDLLLIVQIACKMNEKRICEQQIQEYILLVWGYVQKTHFAEFRLFLCCVQHLVFVSKSYRLPHGATLPVIEWISSSESLFLKLLVLDYLRSLGLRKADDIDPNKFTFLVSSLFGKLLMDRNVLVRERALETFSYFSHITVYEKIIQITIADEPDLAKKVANFLQNRVNPVCEKTCDDFLKNLLHHRRTEMFPADRQIRFENVETDSHNHQSKKIKLDFDFDDEIVKIESNMKLLLSNLSSYELSLPQKDTLKRVLETADELRLYL